MNRLCRAGSSVTEGLCPGRSRAAAASHRKISTGLDEDMVFTAVIHKINFPIGLVDAVHPYPAGVPRLIARFLELDVVEGVAVAVGEFEPGPVGGEERAEGKGVGFQAHAEEIFDEQPVEHGGGPRVPAPTAFAFVVPDRVKIGSEDIGFQFVGSDVFRGVAVADGIEVLDDFPGDIALPEGGKGHGGPHRGMGILSAVFAHAGEIALDITGIPRRGVKGRIEETDEAMLAVDEAVEDGLHRGAGAGGVGGAS